VELQAEKELGLTGSKEENITRVGIEKIVETCKKLIHNYNEKWVGADRLLGMSFNYEKAYWTFRDQYIEREWKYLQSAWESGILKEWFRVVAYCPSCQTSLSNAEVNQGYETVEDPSFYYKVKLVGEQVEDTYLIVWTTMPFTVITDEMVGVNPKANYVFVQVSNKEVWVVGDTSTHFCTWCLVWTGLQKQAPSILWQQKTLLILLLAVDLCILLLLTVRMTLKSLQSEMCQFLCQ
jgi:isoleucyl-tRNA synthetase